MLENSPLFKALVEKLEHPFNTIEKLGVFDNLKCHSSFKPNSLPNIIVLDETSTGPTVIKGLVGVSLPSGFDFPLVLKFQTGDNQKVLFRFDLKFGAAAGVEMEVSETEFKTKIEACMKELSKDHPIPDIEVTLTVIQPKAFDITLVFLPQIRKRSSVEEDTKQRQRFEGYAERYTRVFGGVFLNVLKCSNDGFYDSISRNLLLNLEYDGKRVLTVFTQLDSSSDAVISYITSPKFSPKNPFGFFLVKDDDNKDDEMKDGSKKRRSALLSKFSADKVGFGSISKNLVLAMLSILFHPSSLVVLKIESDLRESMEELDGYKKFDSVGEAMPTIATVFEKALGNLRGLYETDEYGRYRDETSMHVAFLEGV
ncbi:uncharacterized protein LOC143629115 [Bidens hawaiensis]|uniref:uncharacterized protein LOC143629115 n=1 Tax=Bidens hawaiensis TaxID=980011 RepID=UPI00404A7FE9